MADEPPAASLDEDLARTLERWTTGPSVIGVNVLVQYLIASMRALADTYAACEADSTVAFTVPDDLIDESKRVINEAVAPPPFERFHVGDRVAIDGQPWTVRATSPAESVEDVLRDVLTLLRDGDQELRDAANILADGMAERNAAMAARVEAQLERMGSAFSLASKFAEPHLGEMDKLVPLAEAVKRASLEQYADPPRLSVWFRTKEEAVKLFDILQAAKIAGEKA